MKVLPILIILIFLSITKVYSQEGIERQLFVNVSEKNDTLNLFINLYLSNSSSDTIFYPIRPGLELRDGVISSWSDNNIFCDKRPKVIDKKTELLIRFEFPYISHGGIDSFYIILPGKQVNIIYCDNYYRKKKKVLTIQFDDRVVLGSQNLAELFKQRYIDLDNDKKWVVEETEMVKEYRLYQSVNGIYPICYYVNISAKSEVRITPCLDSD